jgi:phage shock protein A
MGLLARASYIIQSKLSALLDRAQDPTEDLDYAHEQMRDQITDLKDAVASIRTQRVRLEKRRDNLQDEVEKHNEQARAAMEQDREDLARRALTKKNTKLETIDDLDSQIQSIRSQEETYEGKLSDLRTRASEFKTEKESMKARYEAAESITEVQETMAGMDDEGVGRAVENAESQLEEMEARAEAIDELETEGVLDSPLSEDDIDAQLEEVTTASEVEAELDSLRAEATDASDADSETEADVELEKLEEELG